MGFFDGVADAARRALAHISGKPDIALTPEARAQAQQNIASSQEDIRKARALEDKLAKTKAAADKLKSEVGNPRAVAEAAEDADDRISSTVGRIRQKGHTGLADEIEKKRQLYLSVISSKLYEAAEAAAPAAESDEDADMILADDVFQSMETEQKKLDQEMDRYNRMHAALQELEWLEKEAGKTLALARNLELRTPPNDAEGTPRPLFADNSNGSAAADGPHPVWLEIRQPAFTYSTSLASAISNQNPELGDAMEAVLAQQIQDRANSAGDSIRDEILRLDGKLKEKLAQIDASGDADSEAQKQRLLVIAKRQAKVLEEKYAKAVQNAPDEAVIELLKAKKQNGELLDSMLTGTEVVKTIGPALAKSAAKVAATLPHGAASLGITTALVAAKEIVTLVRNTIVPTIARWLDERKSLDEVQSATLADLAILEASLKEIAGDRGGMAKAAATAKRGAVTLLYKALNTNGGATLSGVETNLDLWEGKLSLLTMAWIGLTGSALGFMTEAKDVEGRLSDAQQLAAATEEQKREAAALAGELEAALKEIEAKFKEAEDQGAKLGESKTAWLGARNKFELLAKPDFLVALDYHLPEVTGAVKNLGAKLAQSVGLDTADFDFNFEDPDELQRQLSASLTASETAVSKLRESAGGLLDAVVSFKDGIDLGSLDAAKGTVERGKELAGKLKEAREAVQQGVKQTSEAAGAVKDSLTDKSAAGSAEQKMIRLAALKLFQKLQTTYDTADGRLADLQKQFQSGKDNLGPDTATRLRSLWLDENNIQDIEFDLNIKLDAASPGSLQSALNDVLMADTLLGAQAKAGGGPANRALDSAISSELDSSISLIQLARDDLRALRLEVQAAEAAAGFVPALLKDFSDLKGFAAGCNTAINAIDDGSDNTLIVFQDIIGGVPNNTPAALARAETFKAEKHLENWLAPLEEGLKNIPARRKVFEDNKNKIKLLTDTFPAQHSPEVGQALKYEDLLAALEPRLQKAVDKINDRIRTLDRKIDSIKRALMGLAASEFARALPTLQRSWYDVRAPIYSLFNSRSPFEDSHDFGGSLERLNSAYDAFKARGDADAKAHLMDKFVISLTGLKDYQRQFNAKVTSGEFNSGDAQIKAIGDWFEKTRQQMAKFQDALEKDIAF